MSDSERKVSLDAGGLFIVAIIVLVFLYVWPGPCKYDYEVTARGDIIKINRITSQPYIYADGKYQKLIDLKTN